MWRKVFALLALALSTPAVSQTQRVAVPAYFGASSANETDWQRILNAGSTVQIVVVDYNMLYGSESNAMAKFNELHARDVLVLGYVNTDNGARPSSQVFGGGDGQISVDDWYTTYGPAYIDGVFFDRGPQSDAVRSYYEGIYDTMSYYSGYRCRWGTPCTMLNAAQFPNDWVTSVADYITTWELPLTYNSQNYITNFCPSAVYSPSCGAYQNPNGWYFSSIAPYTAHIIYNPPAYAMTAADVHEIVCKSRTRGWPMLYLYDGNSDDYGHLSSLFETTVSEVRYASCDCGSCPDPASVPCGTPMTDACGNSCNAVGTQCTDPAAPYCVYINQDYGYGGYFCVDWHP